MYKLSFLFLFFFAYTVWYTGYTSNQAPWLLTFLFDKRRAVNVMEQTLFFTRYIIFTTGQFSDRKGNSLGQERRKLSSEEEKILQKAQVMLCFPLSKFRRKARTTSYSFSIVEPTKKVSEVAKGIPRHTVMTACTERMLCFSSYFSQ